jgi:hypothetical protein
MLCFPRCADHSTIDQHPIARLTAMELGRRTIGVLGGGMFGASVIGISAIGISSAPAMAQTMAQTPTEPTRAAQALAKQVDAAANQKDSNALLDFYSLEFTNSDGLNRQTLSQSIKQLWQRYPNLTYRTEVISAANQGKGISAETVTYVTGKQKTNGREWKLDVTLKSRQRWENQKLVQQEILAEQTRMSLGEKPPTVWVNLPETIKVGQKFQYEAVVEEPIGDDIMMGEVFEQTVTPAVLTQPNTLQLNIPVLEFFRQSGAAKPGPNVKTLKLQRLHAGGFFKFGFAPRSPENRWLSAVLVRHDAGVTIVTQRLRVVQ